MRLGKWIVWTGLALLAAPGSAFAVDTVVSGVFDGGEQSTAPLPGTCGGTDPLKYQRINNLTVSTTGIYSVADAYNSIGVDVSALLYSGNFNPNAPMNNLVSQFGIDVFEEVSLNSGTNYVLVVQHWCANREGAWALTFTGPGSVNSSAVVSVPDYMSGEFVGSEPTASTECGDAPYQEFGPIQVSSSGTHYYSDVSLLFGGSRIDTCVQIYDAPFNPSSPNNNRVAYLDDWDVVELDSGQNYYVVVQPLVDFGPSTGTYLFLLAPPAPFFITHAMAGGWYNLDTAGQGLVIDVFDNLNQMFMAWFTYDLERPDPAVDAMIGDPGHRWMTAQGPFDSDTADMEITWTSGMIFDSADPPFSQEQDGTMTIQFFDCISGQVTYDLGTANASGQFPIQRLANDARDLCESLIEGPGQPGPL